MDIEEIDREIIRLSLELSKTGGGLQVAKREDKQPARDQNACSSQWNNDRRSTSSLIESLPRNESAVKAVCFATGQGIDTMFPTVRKSQQSVRSSSGKPAWRTRWTRQSPAESSCVLEIKKRQTFPALENESASIYILFSNSSSLPTHLRISMSAKPQGPFMPVPSCPELLLQPFGKTKHKISLPPEATRAIGRDGFQFLMLSFSGSQQQDQGKPLIVHLVSFSQLLIIPIFYMSSHALSRLHLYRI